MTLPKSLTTITRFSKMLAMILFIVFPFFGFYLGIKYNQATSNHSFVIYPQKQSISSNNVPTSTPPTTSAEYIANNPKKFINIIFPKNGEILCTGKIYKIQWQAPPDMTSISLSVGLRNSGPIGFYNLGTFPVSYGNEYNNGKGSFLWKVGYNQSNKTLILSPGYEIIINGIYKGATIASESEGAFTITSCH